MGGTQSIINKFEKMEEERAQMQRLTIERQITMQNIMRERMAAIQFGVMKERFYWLSGFTATLFAGTAHQMTKTGNRAFFLPNIPFIFLLAYQAHMIYGDKAKQIREIAEDELRENPNCFALPLGPITFEELEIRRLKVQDEARFRPNDAFL